MASRFVQSAYRALHVSFLIGYTTDVCALELIKLVQTSPKRRFYRFSIVVNQNLCGSPLPQPQTLERQFSSSGGAR